MDQIRNTSPYVYYALLNSLKGQEKRLAAIADLDYENEENYTWYVHSVLLPKLQKLREAGCLKQNRTKTIKMAKSDMWAVSNQFSKE